MRPILAVALAVAAGLGIAGCGSTGDKDAAGGAPAKGAMAMTIKNYQVIWARGGKLGYLRTYDVVDPARPQDTPVPIHYVLDLDLKTDRGWVSDNGLGERYEYPAKRVREAYRAPFERIQLPSDTIHNQIKRILEVDPALEIVLSPASAADVGQ